MLYYITYADFAKALTCTFFILPLVPKNTMYGWMRAVREGRLDIGKGAHMPQDALTLNEELINLRTRVKQQEKEIKRLKAENEFLEEASAFFAASRRKSPKN